MSTVSPDRRDPQQVFFDARAETWEATCYPPEVRGRLPGLVADFGLPPGARVLDLGTGTGVLYPYLSAALGPAGAVIALDISHAMLRMARHKPPGVPAAHIQATALALPLVDGCCDRVVCFAAFPHFHDPAQALAEMVRVTRPGGEVLIAHLLSRDELRDHHAKHQAVARDVLPTDEVMTALFVAVGLTVPDIVDRPGRYLARAWRSPQGQDHHHEHQRPV
jgi:SAM-dependent methyltransferase